MSVHLSQEASLRTVPEHPFFGDRNLSMAWGWCDGPQPEYRFSSLLTLASNRALLPGAVFFTIPDGAEQDTQWGSILAASEPFCQCTSRRIMYPTQGRSRMLSVWPERRLISLRFDAEYSEGRFYDSPPVVIAPHGGDSTAGFVALTIKGGALYVQQRPFTSDKRPKGMQFWTPLDGIAQRTPCVWRATHDDLRRALLLRGEVPFYERMPDPLGHDGHAGTMPLCSLVEVGGGADGEPLEFVIEVDASVSVVNGVSESDPEHVCPTT